MEQTENLTIDDLKLIEELVLNGYSNKEIQKILIEKKEQKVMNK